MYILAHNIVCFYRVRFVTLYIYKHIYTYTIKHQDALLKEEDIAQAIVDNIEENCQTGCDLSRNQVASGAFQCFQESANRAVTYRTQLLTQNTTGNLIEYISSWVSTNPSVLVRAVLLQVDGSCPLSVASLSDPECGAVTEPESTFNIEVQQSIEWTYLIGGAVGFVVLVLALFCCVLVIILVPVMVLHKKLKKQYR